MSRFQKNGHVFQTTLYREEGDNELPIPIKVEWRIADDSIGAYEYWGERCVDPHKYYPEIEGVYDSDGDAFTLTDRETESIRDELFREMSGIIGDNE